MQKGSKPAAKVYPLPAARPFMSTAIIPDGDASEAARKINALQLLLPSSTSPETAKTQASDTNWSGRRLERLVANIRAASHGCQSPVGAIELLRSQNQNLSPTSARTSEVDSPAAATKPGVLPVNCSKLTPMGKSAAKPDGRIVLRRQHCLEIVVGRPSFCDSIKS
jgi:hypothetical protein